MDRTSPGLYGAHFENTAMQLPLLQNRIPFYGRYLDDVLAFVYADSADEALAIAQHIAFEDVEVEWSASECTTAFLDMELFIDPVSKQIGHRPYRKPLNHRERIPWASHHPKDVKKGTFIGEMSRLATLSSCHEYYSEAIIDLRNLYLARGYPPDLVKNWIRENFGKRWNDRLREAKTKSSSEGAFVLKSHFNPAWSSFNVHDLGETVVNSWLSSLHNYSYQEALRRRQNTSGAGIPGVDLPPEEVDIGAFLAQLAPPISRPPTSAIVDTVQRSLTDIWAGRTWRSGEAGPSHPAGVVGGEVLEHPSKEHSPVIDDLDASNVANAAVGDVSSGLVAMDPVELPVELQPVGQLVPTGRLRPLQWSGRARELEDVLDVRSLNYQHFKWIISRKRNRNLFDLTSTWKKIVLSKAPVEDVLQAHVNAWE